MKLLKLVVSKDDMNKHRKQLFKEGVFHIRSNHSTYIPSRRQKIMLDKVTKDWLDLDGVFVPMTPGEAARTELKREFPGLKRVGWRGADVKLFDWRWPMFFKRKCNSHGVYIDLVSAYLQIYEKIWLDITFPGGFGTLDLFPVARRLEKWKLARNAVIGMVSSRRSSATKDGKYLSISTQNNFLSPHLWASVQACLHELALLAEYHGAVYCMTDGYLFENGGDAEEFEIALLMLGINYRKITGHVDVRGWQSWSMEGVKSTHLYRIGSDGGKPFSNLKSVFDDDPLFMCKHIFQYCGKWKQSMGGYE